MGEARMGEILTSRLSKKGKTILQIELAPRELINLKGKMKKVRIFAKKRCLKKEYIKERGNKNTTKYIPIPVELRPRRKNYKKLTYKKIEHPQGLFYIYGLLMK